MRKTKEILRLKWHHERSNRQIAAALAIGDGMPSEVNARAKAAGLTTWAEVEALTDDELGLSKNEQTSNWTRRPLTPEQIAYAAADVEVLIELETRLRRGLALPLFQRDPQNSSAEGG